MDSLHDGSPYVRYDLSADPPHFDEQWDTSPKFRLIHYQLTRWWVVGLVAEVVIAITVVYTAPLTVAVIATNTLTPVILFVLIALTQIRANHAERPPVPSR